MTTEALDLRRGADFGPYRQCDSGCIMVIVKSLEMGRFLCKPKSSMPLIKCTYYLLTSKMIEKVPSLCMRYQ